MMKKIYIKVDAEGIPGIFFRDQVIYGEHRFEEYRRIVTDTVNVVGKALKEAGKENGDEVCVIVKESHGAANGIIWHELEHVDYLLQGVRHNCRKLPMIEECDGIILLGYHAKANTQDAVLSHTFNMTVQNIYINDVVVGEMAFDAAFAGEAGVPVIMVSGDDKTCREAEELLPGVVTACVKTGTSYASAIMPSPQIAYGILADKCREAMAYLPQAKPWVPANPCTIRVEKATKFQPPCLEPGKCRQLNGNTYEATCETFSEAFRYTLSECY